MVAEDLIGYFDDCDVGWSGFDIEVGNASDSGDTKGGNKAGKDMRPKKLMGDGYGSYHS